MTTPLGRPRLPMFFQAEACECGLASLAMVAAYHGHRTTLSDLRRDMPVSRKGATVEQIDRMAATLGLRTRAVKLDLDQLQHLRLPCIAHWDLEHFVVIRARSARGVVIHDPAVGTRHVSMREFSRRFSGVAIECETAPDFAPRSGTGGIGWRDWSAGLPGLHAAFARVILLAALLEAMAVLMPLQLKWYVDEALPQHTTCR